MRITLYKPSIPCECMTLPLGLLQLAALLKQNGHHVNYIDADLEGSNAAETIASSKPDLLGITSVTAGIPNALTFARLVKKMAPATPVILGGPHASVDSEGMLQRPEIDALVIGEGEKAIQMLAARASLLGERDENVYRDIPGLCYKNSQEVIHSGAPNPELTSAELDNLPIPDFSLVHLDTYFRESISHGLYVRGNRILPIMTSRGCPQRCTFCGHAMGQRFRPLSPYRVIEQVKELVERYNIDALDIEDDNFTLKRDRAMQLLEELERFHLHLRLANGVRADRVDREFLRAFRKAGGYSVVFGIETGSPRVLSMMRKDLTLDVAEQAVRIARDERLLVGANWIIGYPGETDEDFEESLRFFKRLDLDSSAIVNLIPFPGTSVYEECRQKGYLTEESKDWGNYYYNLNDPIPLIETPWMDRRTLRRLTLKAYRSIYLRPKRIMQVFRHAGAGALVRAARLFLRGWLPKRKR